MTVHYLYLTEWSDKVWDGIHGCARKERYKLKGSFYSVRYMKGEIDGVRMSHKFTNPHLKSPSEGREGRIEFENSQTWTKWEQKADHWGYSDRGIFPFSPPDNWNTLSQLKKTLYDWKYINCKCAKWFIWIVQFEVEPFSSLYININM